MDNSDKINEFERYGEPISAPRFVNELGFDFELTLGRDYVENEVAMEILYYEVESSKTEKSKLYGERKNSPIVHKPSKKLKCVINLDDPKQDEIAEGGLKKDYYGTLEIAIYQQHLDENEVTVKLGDIIGYRTGTAEVRYFTIFNPDYVDVSNKKSFYGVRSFARIILARQLDKNEFIPNE